MESQALESPTKSIGTGFSRSTGVVAPADTLKSLHFGEVAGYFTRLKVPRGAYPARAMGMRCWQSLSDANRAVLEAAIPVWEAAMAEETRTAETAGEAEGRRLGVDFIDIAPEQQKRFDALYEAEGERNARELSRFGIDGDSVFRLARRIARGIEITGQVMCE